MHISVAKSIRGLCLLAVLWAGCEDSGPFDMIRLSGDRGSEPLKDAAMAMDAGEDAAVADSGSPDSGLDAAVLDAGEPALRNYDGPLTLQEAGLYKPGTRDLADDIASYVPRYTLWSDGSEKRRYLKLPAGATIDTTDMDTWIFPVGTRVFKEFTVEDAATGVQTLVETRLLEKRMSGWLAVSFVWNAEQSEAVPAPLGQDDVLGTGHRAPSQEDCRACHDKPGDQLLGLDAIQLSHEGGSAPASPLPEVTLASLRSSGVLSDDPGTDAFVLPGDATAQAALGMLHANCGNCHRPGTFAFERTDLALHLTTDALATVTETAAYMTAVNVSNQKRFDEWPLRIAPGDAAQSAMVGRMLSRQDMVAMPPIGSAVPDTAGAAALSAWIDGL